MHEINYRDQILGYNQYFYQEKIKNQHDGSKNELNNVRVQNQQDGSEVI